MTARERSVCHVEAAKARVDAAMRCPCARVSLIVDIARVIKLPSRGKIARIAVNGWDADPLRDQHGVYLHNAGRLSRFAGNVEASAIGRSGAHIVEMRAFKRARHHGALSKIDLLYYAQGHERDYRRAHRFYFQVCRAVS